MEARPESTGADYYAHNYKDYQAQNPPRKLTFYRHFATQEMPLELPRRVHDIGCAFGLFLESLEPDWEIHGSDLNPYGIEHATKLLPHGHFQLAPATQLPNSNSPFGLVTLLDVAEHIPDLETTALSIKTQLAPGGRFFFVVPVYDGLSGPLVRLLDRDPKHLHKWPRQQWLTWAASHFHLLAWQGILRYLLPGGYYLHHPTHLGRYHTPAIAVLCAKR